MRYFSFLMLPTSLSFLVKELEKELGRWALKPKVPKTLYSVPLHVLRIMHKQQIHK